MIEVAGVEGEGEDDRGNALHGVGGEAKDDGRAADDDIGEDE